MTRINLSVLILLLSILSSPSWSGVGDAYNCETLDEYSYRVGLDIDGVMITRPPESYFTGLVSKHKFVWLDNRIIWDGSLELFIDNNGMQTDKENSFYAHSNEGVWFGYNRFTFQYPHLIWTQNEGDYASIKIMKCKIF